MNKVQTSFINMYDDDDADDEGILVCSQVSSVGYKKQKGLPINLEFLLVN